MILHLGDCLEAMRAMPDGHATAIVTDPPYALEFMGKGWDNVLPSVDVWREALRVLRPGGLLLAFGGTRTFHRLTCAVEDAGFEVRDCLCWLYGQGFPKSLAIDKAIDRMRHDRDQVLEVTAWIRAARDAAGITNAAIDAPFGFCGMASHWTRSGSQPAVPTLDQVPLLLEVLGRPEVPDRVSRLLFDLNGMPGQPGHDWYKREVVDTRIMTTTPGKVGRDLFDVEVDVTLPATDRSRPWAGYGTTLKPAWEPIVLAMKPTDGTFAANALAHGVAGLNVDACRVGDSGGGTHCANRGQDGKCLGHQNAGRSTSGETFHGPETRGGRWPANVVHDGSEEVLAAFPDAPGQQGDLRETGRDLPGHGRFGEMAPPLPHAAREDGTKSASRFFYCAKASTRDRGDGNTHPTVKPVELMRWLVRMCRMPSGTRILDPFMGSGTTGVACALEGVDFVGVEREPEYLEIARRRIGACSTS